ncbi:MAG: alpha/beta fold hydrolase [Acidobacteria bacterium]|nr:alpha/beta fold hydrolase [Acidobacteriota bacterium]MDA1235928.1 alpha/beta fold hydrolase [Acidobacteriota bacterium]
MIAWNKDFSEPPAVRGWLHQPANRAKAGIVLTHGAGGNCESPLLIALCDVFAENGVAALRCDLPYRQKRPSGPPSPSGAAVDRKGLERAAASLGEEVGGPVYLGGSSYGGRQASMLAAEKPDVAAGLLLLSYPLHPPGKPEALRTDHFASIRASILFAHGSKDVFGSENEMRTAMKLLKVPAELELFEGATHGLVQKRDGAAKARDIAEKIVVRFLMLVGD